MKALITGFVSLTLAWSGCWAAPARAEEAPAAPVAKPLPVMPLQDAYNPDNPFAQMLRGERHQAKVYEDDQVLAFMDQAPVMPGHVLVISKVSRARNLLDVSPEDLARLMAVVRRVGQAQVAALGALGFTIMQNNGAGQSVPHLHIHVMPRMNTTPLVFGPKPRPDPAELEAVAAKLRAAMR